MYSTAKQVRRAIAIVLTILTVVCLFWPPMVILNTHMPYLAGIDLRSSDAENDAIYKLHKGLDDWGVLGVTCEDVSNYAKKPAESYSEDLERLYNMLKGDKGLSVFETLAFGSLAMRYLNYYAKYFRENDSPNDRYRWSPADVVSNVSWLKFAVICAYILLIGMILCALVSIIMMIAKRSRKFVIAFAVFASVTAVVYTVVVICFAGEIPYPLYNGLYVVAVEHYSALFVGPGIFLLPLFAIGAAVIYPSAKTGRSRAWVCLSCAAKNSGTNRFCKNCGAQRPNGNTGTGTWLCPACRGNNQGMNAFCSHCGAPKPVARPVPKPVSTPPENGWTCVNCGMVNTAQSRFCERCGRIRPAPQPAPEPKPEPQSEPAPEPVSAYKFCPECGTKQEPGARFCMECGKKLI